MSVEVSGVEKILRGRRGGMGKVVLCTFISPPTSFAVPFICGYLRLYGFGAGGPSLLRCEEHTLRYPHSRTHSDRRYHLFFSFFFFSFFFLNFFNLRGI